MEPRTDRKRSIRAGQQKRCTAEGQVCNFSLFDLSNDRKVDTETLNAKSSSFTLERTHTEERGGNAHHSDFAGSGYSSISSRGPALDGRPGKLYPVDRVARRGAGDCGRGAVGCAPGRAQTRRS